MELEENQIQRIEKTFGAHVAKRVVAMGYIPTDRELLELKAYLAAAKNFNFTQINNKYTFDVISALAETSPIALQLLMFLAKNMDDFNALVCTQSLLCEALDRGRTTVYNAVKHLETKGYISVGKQGNNNVYILNDELFWKNKRTYHKYCKFTGNILLSRSENKELFEKLEKQAKVKFENTKQILKR